ncbi:MAG TPA: polyprenyl synthetase family protein [Gemmatimonadales bacterium]|nr:polyprenyl synthetase family protein [Gemmatimonadales bacterium]
MAEVATDPATALLAEARAATDARLERWAARIELMAPGPGAAAVAYALRSPGKRVRAALVLGAYRAAGGRSDPAGVAAAAETVHAYSLVHDDLPCMDDDDLRRGRPTTHRVFGVPVATRAGYLLVPVAACVLAEAADELGLGEEVLGRMAVELFEAGGIEGMVGGQWRDLAAEGRALDLAELTAIHRGKTGALIRAACMLGGLAAAAPPPTLAALGRFGEDIGLAFQIADDVLDATGTSDALGKTAGRDAALNKSTYVGLLGVDAARAEAASLVQRALARLGASSAAGVDGALAAGSLASLAQYIVTRSS